MRHLALVAENAVLMEWRREWTSKAAMAYNVTVPCEHSEGFETTGGIPASGFQALRRKSEAKSCRIYLAIW